MLHLFYGINFDLLWCMWFDFLQLDLLWFRFCSDLQNLSPDHAASPTSTQSSAMARVDVFPFWCVRPTKCCWTKLRGPSADWPESSPLVGSCLVHWLVHLIVDSCFVIMTLNILGGWFQSILIHDVLNKQMHIDVRVGWIMCRYWACPGDCMELALLSWGDWSDSRGMAHLMVRARCEQIWSLASGLVVLEKIPIFTITLYDNYYYYYILYIYILLE